MEAIDRVVGAISRRVAAQEESSSPERLQRDAREIAEDLATLNAHRDPRPGVRMQGRAPLCATCGERMPCAPLRTLAARYDVAIESPEEEAGVRSATGVEGPTGVRTMTPGDESRDDADGSSA